MKHDKYLDIAKKKSFKSDHHTHKLGAVIVKKNKIIGVGYNILGIKDFKSPHPFKSIHAEYLAFLNSSEDIRGSTVYVFRQHKNGTSAMARPCTSCFNFLISKGVSKIVYTFEGSYKEEKLG